jgi:hypothetical protein
VCHGNEAHGNGPAAAALTPRPTNLSRFTKRTGSFPAAKVKAAIRGTDPAGPHYLEIRKLGMVPLAVEKYVVVNHTTTYRATMQPADGEARDAGDDTE